MKVVGSTGKADVSPQRVESEPQAIFDLAMNAVLAAGYHFAERYRLMHRRDDLVSEVRCRVVAIIQARKPPFDPAESAAQAADDELRRRIVNYVYGVAHNVIREMAREEKRRAREVDVHDRAGIAMGLAITEPDPSVRAELNETVRMSLERFRLLSAEMRETLVAEEVRQHGYGDETVEELCGVCEVSIERVRDMIQQRDNGMISGAAWRQRVHRLRERAREALGDLHPTIAGIGLLAFGAAVAAWSGAAASTGGSATELVGPPAPWHVVQSPAEREAEEAWSFARSLLIASTQNGKPKKN